MENLWWRIQNGGFPKQVKKTVISIGTNNIKYNNLDLIAKTIMKIADYVKNTGSLVYICEQFPRENSRTSLIIRTLNGIVQNLCKIEKVPFIRNNDIFWKGNSLNENLFSSDKVHLKSYGYQMFCQNIVFNIKEYNQKQFLLTSLEKLKHEENEKIYWSEHLSIIYDHI